MTAIGAESASDRLSIPPWYGRFDAFYTIPANATDSAEMTYRPFPRTKAGRARPSVALHQQLEFAGFGISQSDQNLPTEIVPTIQTRHNGKPPPKRGSLGIGVRQANSTWD